MLDRSNNTKITKRVNPQALAASEKVHAYSLMPVIEKASLLLPLQGLTNATEPSFKRIASKLNKLYKEKHRLTAIGLDIINRGEPLSYRCKFEDAIAYLSVARTCSKVIMDYYHALEFETFRVRPIDEYQGIYVEIIECELDLYQRHMQARFDDCWEIHTENNQKKQTQASFHRNSKLINAAYQEIESMYEAASQVLAELAQIKPSYNIEYRILRIRIEAMIHRSQLFTKNVKSHASDVLRSYKRIREISDKLSGEATPIEILNLRARIAQHVEKNNDAALKLADEIDESITAYALNLDFDEQQLGTWVNHNALLKLSIHLKTIDESKPLMLSSLNTLVKDALSAKDSIGGANESLKAQFFKVTDKLITNAVAATVLMAGTSKLSQLQDCQLFFESLDELFKAYEASLPRSSFIVTGHSIETHQLALVKVKKLVDEKINRLVKSAEADRANFEALERRMAQYEEDFESTLSQFEREVKARVLARPLVHEPKPRVALPTTNEPITHVENAFIAIEKKSVAQAANDYFNSLDAPEAIENFLNEVLPENTAEALLYMGYQYLSRSLIGSAITCYERAINELPRLILGNEELLKSIQWSLEEAQALVAKQIEYGSTYLEKAESERRRFIVSLGLKASMNDHPERKYNLHDEKTQAELYGLGLEIFKQMGEERRGKHLPVSKKTERMRDIKARLLIFKDNQSKLEKLINQTEATLKKPAFPSLKQSQVVLFAQPSCKDAKGRSQPVVKQRRKKR